jgi:O-antigen/teichoic acid export membrane protein
VVNLRRWIGLTDVRNSSGNARQVRARGIFAGTLSALGKNGLGFLVSIVSVPLTVRYLGGERYGAWVTISSVLAFLSFTDFGLANSLTNALGKAEATGARDSGKRYVSSAFVALSFIALVILVLGIAFAPQLAAFVFPALQSANARGEIVPTVAISLSIFALNFPLLITNRVLAAHQENAVANLWSMAGSIANLIAILAVISLRGGLPWLVLGCSGFGLLTNVTSTFWLFGFHKPQLRPSFASIDVAFVRELFSDGWKFLVIGLGWMINSQTDNIVIAHFLGAGQVTPYSVAFRLFAIATMLQTLAYPSLWPAYTNAFAQKDFGWIRRTFRSSFVFSFLATLVIVTVLLVFGRQIIRLWAGAAAVPPFSVLVWMAIWNLMLSNLYVASCLLNATGHLRGMTIYGSVTAVLNLILSILLVRTYGIAGVIAGTVIAFALANYIPTFIETRGVLRKLRQR